MVVYRRCGPERFTQPALVSRMRGRSGRASSGFAGVTIPKRGEIAEEERALARGAEARRPRSKNRGRRGRGVRAAQPLDDRVEHFPGTWARCETRTRNLCPGCARSSGAAPSSVKRASSGSRPLRPPPSNHQRPLRGRPRELQEIEIRQLVDQRARQEEAQRLVAVGRTGRGIGHLRLDPRVELVQLARLLREGPAADAPTPQHQRVDGPALGRIGRGERAAQPQPDQRDRSGAERARTSSTACPMSSSQSRTAPAPGAAPLESPVALRSNRRQANPADARRSARWR